MGQSAFWTSARVVERGLSCSPAGKVCVGTGSGNKSSRCTAITTVDACNKLVHTAGWQPLVEAAAIDTPLQLAVCTARAYTSAMHVLPTSHGIAVCTRVCALQRTHASTSSLHTYTLCQPQHTTCVGTDNAWHVDSSCFYDHSSACTGRSGLSGKTSTSLRPGHPWACWDGSQRLACMRLCWALSPAPDTSVRSTPAVLATACPSRRQQEALLHCDNHHMGPARCPSMAFTACCVCRGHSGGWGSQQRSTHKSADGACWPPAP